MFKLLLTICAALLPLTAFGQGSLSDMAAEQIVLEYLQMKQVAPAEVGGFNDMVQMFNTKARRGRGCDDDKGSGSACVDAFCERLPSYNCDSTSDLRDVAKACLGVRGSGCVNAVCDRLPSYNCDSLSDVEEVGEACRGVRGVGCISAVCDRMPSYNCDSLSDMKEVGEICRDTDDSCIDSVCSRLPSYNCDSISDLKEVAKACRGE